MGDGQIFLKLYAPLSLMKASFRIKLDSAGFISLDSTCKDEVTVILLLVVSLMYV